MSKLSSCLESWIWGGQLLRATMLRMSSFGFTITSGTLFLILVTFPQRSAGSMKPQTLKALELAAEDLDLYDGGKEPSEVSFRDDYSGRGMYGSTTHAIIVPNFGVLAALAAKAGANL